MVVVANRCGRICRMHMESGRWALNAEDCQVGGLRPYLCDQRLNGAVSSDRRSDAICYAALVHELIVGSW